MTVEGGAVSHHASKQHCKSEAREDMAGALPTRARSIPVEQVESAADELRREFLKVMATTTHERGMLDSSGKPMADSVAVYHCIGLIWAVGVVSGRVPERCLPCAVF